jgi:hypothetical protein
MFRADRDTGLRACPPVAARSGPVEQSFVAAWWTFGPASYPLRHDLRTRPLRGLWGITGLTIPSFPCKIKDRQQRVLYV